MGLLSRHSIAFTIFILLMLAPRIAQACSCSHPYPSDYLRGVDQVFDGYVESISRDESGKYPIMKALVRVEKVWKGVLPDQVIFAYSEADAACQYGRMRAKVYHRFYTRGDPVKGFLGASWCDRMIASPRNTALQRELRRYADRWQELSAKAKTGGAAEKFDFAQFLLDHGDETQALDEYQEVVRIDEGNAAAWLGFSEALANLGRAEESAKARERASSISPEMRGPALRAEFERTGRLDPTWKDWSNLTVRKNCSVNGMQLTDMTFGGSTLYNCSFQDSVLQSIDFTGVKMFGSNFDHSTLRSVTFRNVNIGSISLKGADIADAVLTGSIGGDFSDAQVVRVEAASVRASISIQRARLTNVNFSHAHLGYLDARGARFESVNLTGADLSRANFQGADLSGADLNDADLSMAHIDCTTLLPPALDIRQRGARQVLRFGPAFSQLCRGRHATC